MVKPLWTTCNHPQAPHPPDEALTRCELTVVMLPRRSVKRSNLSRGAIVLAANRRDNDWDLAILPAIRPRTLAWNMKFVKPRVACLSRRWLSKARRLVNLFDAQ